MAGRLAQLGGDDTPIGVHWVDGYRKRNPRVSTLIGRYLDKTESMDQIQMQFKVFSSCIKRSAMIIISRHKIDGISMNTAS
ncbi:hypothetical protein K402DRAFT_437350 [Aulographum hederae CBS 113979]|uniref:Uncharacterized protein n=1 Tax=Aulographum hederae CBS 113979 TaxID=1176131 RepID=A0A6G1GQ06_9PEZI|nr:hypothetical protein K402DRAFT_437350 [Aulographum hederae CBS 113979]